MKGGPFVLFETPFVCKICKKLKGVPFGDKVSEKNPKISEQCHSAENCERDPLGQSIKFQKKSHNAEKNLSEKHLGVFLSFGTRYCLFVLA